MYLIDSSAWIEYLRPHGSQRIKERVREILRREAASCCGIVTVEVLRGARNDKDWKALRDALAALPQLPLDVAAIERAAQWGYQLDRTGITVSTTDLLIAAAAYKKAKLLHTDNDFTKIAAVTGLAEEYLTR